jgi:DeoR family fructose operon transcriptional repressor
MGGGSIASNRHVMILEMLHRNGTATVDQLSDMLGVSKVTVRRDLDQLDAKGMLVRTHGGATGLHEQDLVLKENEFSTKGTANVREKQRIALTCLELIEDNETLFLNSGSTTLCILQALADRHMKIVTNNAASIDVPFGHGIELLVLGGEYRRQSRSFVGEFALRAIKDIYSNHTILGTNGLSLERGLTTTVHQECSINQAMIANTHGKVIVLADHTKLGTVANFVSAPLGSIDILITDEGCPDSFKSGLEERGVEVIIA